VCVASREHDVKRRTQISLLAPQPHARSFSCINFTNWAITTRFNAVMIFFKKKHRVISYEPPCTGATVRGCLWDHPFSLVNNDNSLPPVLKDEVCQCNHDIDRAYELQLIFFGDQKAELSKYATYSPSHQSTTATKNTS
jgi:hypothetical protein